MKSTFAFILPGTCSCSAVLLALILAGCATPAVVHRDPALHEWTPERRTIDMAGTAAPMAASSLPAALMDRQVAPDVVTLPMQANVLPTNVISDLELTDEAEVATILRTLAKAASVNMLVSPGVTGRMRFTFNNVPWDQAFTSVINAEGLTYMWEGDVLRVMTIADVKRGVEMETLLKERESLRAEKRAIEPMAIQVIPLKYAKARSVGQTVRALIATEAARATVSIDEDNNAIIVHAIPEEIDKTVALIGQLDRAKSQIHIEARIVEATRDTARQLGIQWGGASAQIQNNRLISAGGQGVTRSGFNSDFAAQFAQSAAAPTAGFSMGLVSERIGGSELLNMQLTALQSRGRIQILSSPSITTLDNESAIIESGEERAYRVTTGTGNELDVTVEWKKAVLKLEVTPQVIDGDTLRVDVIANKDSFDETKQQSNNEFPISTKKAMTSVLLRNGETMVIGGLSLESRSNSESGIPWLMDIPGLGYLFKNKGQAKRFDETLIFITPKILATPQ
jgi:type IV pilus assembly protein PilQ